MNVVYSSDENYAQHTAASIASLLSRNTWAESITVYVISSGISSESKAKLKKTCDLFGRQYIDIPFEPYIDRFKDYATWHSLGAYARMFIPEMLSDQCEKALYLDCDTLVVDSLQNLWTTDLQGKLAGGVKDTISDSIKKSIDFSESDDYFNTGVLLLELNKWREQKVQTKLVEYLISHRNMELYQDQSAINAVLKGQILALNPRYNAMTTFFTLSYKRMMNLYGLSRYYAEDELKKATANPAIVHCTSGVVDRAWAKNSSHPFAKVYLESRQMTPWKDEPLQKSNLSFKDQLVRLLQKRLPISLLRYL